MREFVKPSRRSYLTLTMAAFVALFFLSACSSDKKKDSYNERPVDQIYNDALSSLLAGKYKVAATKFDEVERQHPYSSWATKSQLMSAYSHYMNNSYDEAIVALNRFIQLHPTNRDVAYAYYLKGLSYYEQISDVARDQKMTELALKTLQELVTRFPDSKYTRDAKIKLDLTHDHLAGKEMEIGRYYLGQKHYLAAINRFKTVIDQYQTTTHVPEALHRLVEAYSALGLKDEAKKTAAVLGHNFPGNEWYVDSYQLVEGKKIRSKDDKPWYMLWGGGNEKQTGSAPPPPGTTSEKKPWYKIW